MLDTAGVQPRANAGVLQAPGDTDDRLGIPMAMRDEDVRQGGIERLGRLNGDIEAIQRMRLGFLLHPVDRGPQHIEGPPAGIRVMAQAPRNSCGRRAQRRVQNLPRHSELVAQPTGRPPHIARPVKRPQRFFDELLVNCRALRNLASSSYDSHVSRSAVNGRRGMPDLASTEASSALIDQRRV
ncbi:MAG TPA: hypothetical protein VI094_06490 [Propionibacteriaceae bacterium]